MCSLLYFKVFIGIVSQILLEYDGKLLLTILIYYCYEKCSAWLSHCSARIDVRIKFRGGSHRDDHRYYIDAVRWKE